MSKTNPNVRGDDGRLTKTSTGPQNRHVAAVGERYTWIAATLWPEIASPNKNVGSKTGLIFRCVKAESLSNRGPGPFLTETNFTKLEPAIRRI